MVALTKVDLVDADLVALARLEVADQLAGTFLADAEVVEVAAPRGRAWPTLRAALDRTLRATPTVADTGRPRLWVDRAFAAKGAGHDRHRDPARAGRVAVDDQLVRGPRRPDRPGPRHPGPPRGRRPGPPGSRRR